MTYLHLLLVLAAVFSACESPSQPSSLKIEAPVSVVAPTWDYEEQDDYHTRHLDKQGKPLFVNALAAEASPYLRQHAHNPVDWVPWGPEVFERARREGRPILLSIGYSTCHWCHVMASESFEDLEIAEFINSRYVAVKVDREERPDVDALYMAAVQRIAGRGGWPMTVWLTPDGEPFHAATYIPPRAGARGAHKGFAELLVELSDKFDADSDAVVRSAREITAEVVRAQQVTRPGGVGDPRRVLQGALFAFARSYDTVNHGWGRQKFPMPARLRFLLRASAYDVPSNNALQMATETLDTMARGGIFDHLAGGFHRYTTDPTWTTPHFEKMLYDNAMLIRTYAEAWQLTKSPLYAEVVRRTVDYLLREMRTPEGGFYAATDADSEGEEGKFFVWTPAQVDAAAPEHAELLKSYFGIVEHGNFEGGATVLRVAMSKKDCAAKLGLPAEKLKSQLNKGVEQLRTIREKRVPPHRDEKLISAWNGLAIDALAYAGFAFDEPSWIAAAEEAAVALPTADGRLKRSQTHGRLGPNAFADDYTFVIGGLITLFEVTGKATHLQRARMFQGQLDAQYRDADRGGYFLSDSNHASELPVRQKVFYDGAIPSANSVALMNVIRLAALGDDAQMTARRDELLRVFGASLSANPASAPQMLLGLDWLDGDAKEVVIVGDEAPMLLAVLRENFVPHVVLARAGAEDLVPWVAGKTARGGVATAYVCRAFTCKLPTTEPTVFAEQLRAP